MNSSRSIPAILILAASLAAGTAAWWARTEPTAEDSAVGHGRAAQRHVLFPTSVARRGREVPHPPPVLDAEGKSRLGDFDSLRAQVMDDAEAAACQALGSGPDAVVAVIAAWVELDVESAVRWARSLEGIARSSALGTLATELASRDPQLAMELALAIDAGAIRDEAVAFVAAQCAAEDLDEGLRWTRELKDAHLRAMVEQRVLPAVASRTPEAAARYVAEEMDGSAVQSIVAVEVLQRWVQSDPEGAAAWVGEFPEPEFRTQGLDALLRVWSDQNAAALEAWWRNQPAGTFRDEVASAMAGILAQTDRTVALGYAEGIADPKCRAIAREKALAP